MRYIIKYIVAGALLLFPALVLSAQQYKLSVSSNVPEQASAILVQRFTQMLEAGGLSVAPEGETLEIVATVTSQTEVSGSLALTAELVASCGSATETFPVKGVGESEADAWLRAVKQLLPRSKAAQSLVEKLKASF